jgi:hypothetical protein
MMTHRTGPFSVTMLLCLGLFACSSRQGGIDDPGGPGGGGGGTGRDGGAACEGLECKVASCPPGGETIVRGRVTAPNGVDPIRDAIVYVPVSGAPSEFPQGVACEVCNNPVGGRTVTQAYTDIDGNFELRRVPVTASTPIVIQKGRWRRTATLSVNKCQSHDLGVEQARLPRNQGEGGMPRMAVAVGDYDAIECVLRHVGIDRGEFTSPAQAGTVHLYDNEYPEGIGRPGPGAPGGVNVSTLLRDLNKMLQYHLIFLNCAETTYSADLLREAGVKKNLVDYVSRGGRLYTTDWSYDYIQQPAPFSPFICFNDDKPCTDTAPHGFAAATAPGRGGGPEPFTAVVNQSTPSGKALATWLSRLDLTPKILDGKFQVVDLLPDWVLIRQTAADMGRFPSTTWLTGTVKNQNRPMTVTFDYPVPPAQSCGKVLYSSYHTREHTDRLAFPRYCPAGKMIPQEYVLEFLIFEISSCVGPIG